MKGLTRVLLFGLIASVPLQRPATVQHSQGPLQEPTLRLVQYVPVYSCCTQTGRCQLPQPQPIGSPCECGGTPGNAC